ncbi:hypothetical protein [Alteromonas australica]|uniref:hypothetical protein n=1 Tax=Alteromonas australica TaxID=589873 RepID=UPI0035C86558
MKHWFKFIGWAKISAVAAFVSTIIGVAFQKGMLEKMGFGNMSGNYQIEEIISSAIHVYLMIGNSITELSTWKMLLTNSYIIMLFFVMGPILWLAHNKHGRVDHIRSEVNNYVSVRLKRARASGPVFTLISTLTGVFVWGATGLFKYVLVLLFAVALLPIYMSYAYGQKFISGLTENRVCSSMNEDSLKKNLVRQCTHLTIKGHEIAGLLILERPDGYFFQTDSAFIFINKSGEQCLFSGYSNKNDMKGKRVEDLSFENTQIQSACIKNFRDKVKN